MIVYPAYIYMGREQPVADPNLWANGVVNVPYTGLGYSFSSQLDAFELSYGGHIDFTVPAYGYSKLTFVAANISHAVNAKTYYVSIIDGGVEIGKTNLSCRSNEGAGGIGTFNIPDAYRKNGIVIRVYTDEIPRYNIRLISATLG